MPTMTSHSENWDKKKKKLMKKEKTKMTIHEFVINEILTLRDENKSLKQAGEDVAFLYQEAKRLLTLIGVEKVGDHYEVKRTIFYDEVEKALIEACKDHGTLR